MGIPRRQSKTDLANALVAIVRKHMDAGMTAEQALGELSVRQYDFLCDFQDGAYIAQFENPEVIAAAREQTKARRTVKPGGYNKKYPQAKQDLYNALVALIQDRGGEVTPAEKCNFRDLDFTIDGTAYRIVLSNPRK